MACAEAGESGANIPASMYMPFTLSLSLALRIALSTSSRPMYGDALPVSWPITSSLARSCITPESERTNTELSFTVGVACVEAIMPMSDTMPSSIMMAVTAMMPVTVARVYFRKSFMTYVCFACLFCRAAPCGRGSRLACLSGRGLYCMQR